MSDKLRERILALCRESDLDPARKEDARAAFAELRAALNDGSVRAAEPGPEGWRLCEWVRQGILLGFRVGENRNAPETGVAQARDRDTLPLRAVEDFHERSRVVPGGSSIRDGAYIGAAVVCMPPMYINIGAWVDDETMIDSHALVGSCAQVGKRCHIGAAAQIGGVLEPPGAWPVIVEDDVFVGAGACLVEGVLVGRGAVIGAGTTVTASTPVYDLAVERVHVPDTGRPLAIPPGAVVVPGARRARGDFARRETLSVATPLIVRYRRDGESPAAAIQSALR